MVVLVVVLGVVLVVALVMEVGVVLVVALVVVPKWPSLVTSQYCSIIFDILEAPASQKYSR